MDARVDMIHLRKEYVDRISKVKNSEDAKDILLTLVELVDVEMKDKMAVRDIIAFSDSINAIELARYNRYNAVLDDLEAGILQSIKEISLEILRKKTILSNKNIKYFERSVNND